MEKEKNPFKRRTIICVVIVSLIFIAFIIRLFDWQIIHGEEYRRLGVASTSYTVSSQAVRGEIYDINGVALAVNNPQYDLVLDRLYLKKDTENSTILKLIDILNKCDEVWINNLPIVLDEKGNYIFSTAFSAEKIVYMKTELLELSEFADAQSCINKFIKNYELERIGDKAQLLKLISVKYNMQLNDFSNTKPYVFAEDISQSSVSIISELATDLSGVEINTTLVRTNENPTLAPHIVGAIGSLSEEEYEQVKDSGYSYDDVIGKFGIEQAMEAYLKGKSGSQTVQKNSDGTIVGIVDSEDAQPGNTVYLTLDADIQAAANKALAENVTAARKSGEALQKENNGKTGYGEDCIAGAVVMLDVKDFSVIAASTYPTFDLSKYYEDEYYTQLATDELSPMFDRAFNGSFAPGSIYKPCVASAALEERVITDTEAINCTHLYSYYDDSVIACLGYHGPIAVRDALRVSCNYFFAETGRRLGIDTLYLYSEKFGLGVRTGVEISESTGTLAGRDSRNWYVGNTCSAAIGQSDNAFTPIQLATYAATIANNGVRLRTHLVSKITDYSGENIVLYNNPEQPEIVENTGISAENINVIKEGMRSVVTNGTAASYFSNYPVSVAAKTGTAENAGSDHVTFICFAPYENPEVAVAVVLEHGAKGMYAQQTAKAVLDAYFSKQQAVQPTIAE